MITIIWSCINTSQPSWIHKSLSNMCFIVNIIMYFYCYIFVKGRERLSERKQNKRILNVLKKRTPLGIWDIFSARGMPRFTKHRFVPLRSVPFWHGAGTHRPICDTWTGSTVRWYNNRCKLLLLPASNHCSPRKVRRD